MLTLKRELAFIFTQNKKIRCTLRYTLFHIKLQLITNLDSESSFHSMSTVQKELDTSIGVIRIRELDP